MFPRGAVPTKLALEVFDPRRIFAKYPHLFQNVHLDSLPKFMVEIRDFYSEIEQKATEGAHTVALGTHGTSIAAQLMVLGGIPAEKFLTVKDEIYPGMQAYPNVGISIMAFHPDTRKWELLVFKDNSYLPEKLKHGTTGLIKTRWTKFRYKLVALKRYFEHKLSGKNPHPVHRDYYPRGKYSWWWNVISPTETAVIERHAAFLRRYPDREKLRLQKIANLPILEYSI